MTLRGKLFPILVFVPCVAASCATKKSDPPSLTREALMDPASCNACHKDQVRAWSGSMHAYASDDPVFLAMNRRGQRETKGALGTFCVNCHAPMAVSTGATKDGLNLDTLPAPMKGVTCFFCHSVDRVEGTHNNPLHLADDNVIRGEFSDPVANSAHRAAYSPLHDRDQAESATLCGACHDIATQHGANIERTFSEWQGSVFSKLGGGDTCSQCHMEQSKNLEPIAQAPGVFARRTHSHSFAGVDVALTATFPEVGDQRQRVQALLDTTLQSALCVETQGSSASIRVILDNVGAGHSWPSGASSDRRAWTEVIAYKDGQVIYKSGVVPDGTDVTKLADPDLWLLRDCLFDDQGNQVPMFWQAASYETNTLIGQLTFDQTDPRYYRTHIVQSFPRDTSKFLSAAPDRVTLRVRLRPMGQDVLEDLVMSGDLDPAINGKIPTFDVGKLLEWTPVTATAMYQDNRVPVLCTAAPLDFNVGADKVPASNHTRCAP
jgi:hypothetical protein